MAALQFHPLPAGATATSPHLHVWAGAASSVDIGHALEPFGHAAVSLGGSFTRVGAQESVHVVAVLVNGVLYTSDVQPADDHPEELPGERGGKRMGGEKERREGDGEGG